jgi:RNA polymerase sigma-70 factor (ECF subfamily)
MSANGIPHAVTSPLTQRTRTDRAFERLYRKHVLDVYRFALVVLRSPEDAEDVTQTTFLNAYRAFIQGERRHATRKWLLGIAHGVCSQRAKQASARLDEVEADESLEQAVPDEDVPTAGDIRRALGRLPFDQRAALVMREIEVRTYQEIAEILNVSIGEVETLVFRARRALREQLEGSLTCHQAERAISRKLDGRLSLSGRGGLRAHLRECDDCSSFARSQRAQRTALRRLAKVPLPSSLTSFTSFFRDAGTGGTRRSSTRAQVSSSARV